MKRFLHWISGGCWFEHNLGGNSFCSVCGALYDYTGWYKNDKKMKNQKFNII